MMFNETSGVRRRHAFLLAYTFGVAVFLRLCWIGAVDLWFDEVISVFQASDLGSFFVQLRGEVFEPPGFTLVLSLWIRLFGDSEVAVRLLSATASALCVPLTYLLARRFYGRPAAVLGAFAVAVSPFFVWYAQEARVYSLAALVTLAFVCAGLEAQRTGRPLWFVSFSSLVFLGVFLDYFVLLPAFSMASFLFLSEGNRLKRIGPTFFFLLLFAVFGGPVLLKQISHLRQGFWLVSPDFSQLGFVLGNLIAGYTAPVFLLVGAAVFLGGLYAFWLVQSLRTKEGVLLFSLTLAPVLVVFIFSQIVPVFVARKFLIFAPFFFIVLAQSVQMAPGRWTRTLLFLGLSVLMAVPLFNYYRVRMPASERYHMGTPEKKLFKPLLDVIAADWEQGDIIVHAHPSTLMPTLYYFRAKPVPQLFLTRVRNDMDYWTRIFWCPDNLESYLRRKVFRRHGWFDVTSPRMDELKGHRLWVISSDWSKSSSAIRGILAWRGEKKLTLECDGVLADLIVAR